jgi:outer membrane murein-binding lipoprotein Lpp
MRQYKSGCRLKNYSKKENAMKTLLTTIAVLCLLVAGCNDSQMTVAALSSPNQDLTARVGVLQGDAEIGVTGKYNHADNVEWDELTPDIMGPYLLFHLTQDASIEDTAEPSPIGPLLESLHARPYAGLEVVGPFEGARSMQPNFIVGSTFTLDPAANIGLVVEYIDGDMVDTGEVYIGGVLRF